MYLLWARALFHALSRSATLKRLTSRYGMASGGGFARRFVAGETIEETIEAVRALERRGLHLTLDYLGESVDTIDAARAAADQYVRLIAVIVEAGIERNLSLKLTQLGLELDRDACEANLRVILDAAAPHGFFVRVDMESSAFTEATIDVFERLWASGYRAIGLALQAYLRRTEADVRRMNALGVQVRLVKGAYMEPAELAFERKADVDASYERLMDLLLDGGTRPAIATHDEVLIERACARARERGIPPDRFEFEMLYGIRRDLQASLTARGYRVRVYVPFGTQWYPYFMRRLGERPANLAFVVRSLLNDSGPAHGQPADR
ncbi:MAG: proline dehydrogenase [Acidobacteria bacterium]|nr:proline dehydrogenase [Acidobacteriota bacterium]